MKQVDRLKKQRYQIEMKMLNMEEREKKNSLSKNEKEELNILRKKKEKLDAQIEKLS